MLNIAQFTGTEPDGNSISLLCKPMYQLQPMLLHHITRDVHFITNTASQNMPSAHLANLMPLIVNMLKSFTFLDKENDHAHRVQLKVLFEVHLNVTTLSISVTVFRITKRGGI
jgi:hypothetical protein